MQMTVKAEIKYGRLNITRLEIIDVPEKITKWDLLSEEEKESYKNTPFGNGIRACSRCQTPLPTEADFAKHYIIDDLRYINLGHCSFIE